MNTSRSGRPDYGIDAPPVIRNLSMIGVAGLGLGIAGLATDFFPSLAFALVITGFSFLASAGMMVWSSKVGKLKKREHLLDSLRLQGNETLLDVGCGRGLLLNAAARRLTSGKAFGVDLWRNEDQSGNSSEKTLANARAEGVADRVEVRTADMRQLPFADNSIDVVVSSLAIHNIPDSEGRAAAVREIGRVLRPGGKVALLDFQCTDEYAAVLQGLGWNDVVRSGLSFAMYPPVRLVTGTKL